MNLVLADSNELIRLGIRVLVNTELEATIVGEANSNEVLVELLRSFDVDVVVHNNIYIK